MPTAWFDTHCPISGRQSSWGDTRYFQGGSIGWWYYTDDTRWNLQTEEQALIINLRCFSPYRWQSDRPHGISRLAKVSLFSIFRSSRSGLTLIHTAGVRIVIIRTGAACIAANRLARSWMPPKAWTAAVRASGSHISLRRERVGLKYSTAAIPKLKINAASLLQPAQNCHHKWSTHKTMMKFCPQHKWRITPDLTDIISSEYLILNLNTFSFVT